MLSSSARRLQLTKERQHLTVRKKVRWCRAIPFQHFPKENVIFKNARISIPTTRVFGKYPRVRQICPQMEKLAFLETWKMNWGSAKATNHCGTFICRGTMCRGTVAEGRSMCRLASRLRCGGGALVSHRPPWPAPPRPAISGTSAGSSISRALQAHGPGCSGRRGACV